MNQGEQMMRQAIEYFQRSYPHQSLAILDQLVAHGVRLPEMNFLRALCLSQLGDFAGALKFAEAELAQNPAHQAAKSEAEALRKVVANIQAQLNPQRSFNSSLPREVMLLIERASLRYMYKGVRLMKNPFDLALYPLLIANLKPRTLLEIGSCDGGSAIWFADMFNTLGIDGHIHSVDVVKVEQVKHDRVTFIKGDGRNLGQTFTPEILAGLPRPWLVIEDADHSYETSLSVCEFFHPHLREGEYMVVEDGMSASGPRQALAEFLPKHQKDYAIDTSYTDFFGFNMTWAVNGYLRKMTPAANETPAVPQEEAVSLPTEAPRD